MGNEGVLAIKKQAQTADIKLMRHDMEAARNQHCVCLPTIKDYYNIRG
jgi:hypothetical protein